MNIIGVDIRIIALNIGLLSRILETSSNFGIIDMWIIKID